MWKNLSVGQQADIIGMAAKQGITDINQIEDLYNYSSGAITPEELGKSGQHNELQQQQDGIKAFEMAEKEYLIRQRMERNGMGQTKPYNGYFTQSTLPENNNSLFGDKGTKFAYGGNTVSGSNRWYSFVEKYLPLIEAELAKYNDAHKYLAKNLLWQMAQESEYGMRVPNKTNFWGIRNPGKTTYRDFGTFEKGLAYWIQQIHDNYPDAWKAANAADYAMGLTTGNNGFRYMEASPLQYMQNMKTLERYYNQYMLDNNRNIETENESYTPIQQTIVTPQQVFESGVQQNPVNNQTQGQQSNANNNESNASFQEWLDNLYDDGFAYGGPTKPTTWQSDMTGEWERGDFQMIPFTNVGQYTYNWNPKGVKNRDLYSTESNPIKLDYANVTAKAPVMTSVQKEEMGRNVRDWVNKGLLSSANLTPEQREAVELVNMQDNVARRPGYDWFPAAVGLALTGTMGATFGPQITQALINPVTDAALTLHGAITAPKNIKEGINEIKNGSYGRGALDLGFTALDLLGAGELVGRTGRMLNKAYRAKHAYNTIAPAGYDEQFRRGKEWLRDLWYNPTVDLKNPKWLEEAKETVFYRPSGWVNYMFPEGVKTKEDFIKFRKIYSDYLRYADNIIAQNNGKMKLQQQYKPVF